MQAKCELIEAEAGSAQLTSDAEFNAIIINSLSGAHARVKTHVAIYHGANSVRPRWIVGSEVQWRRTERAREF